MLDKIRRFWWAVAAACVGAGLILAVVLWPGSSGGRNLPPTRARAYAAWGSVWAGMEQASAKTSAKVSYLAVAGEDTAGNAQTYLATAAGEQCDLVIAVGGPQLQGVASVASRFPRTRFAVVGHVSAGSNVSQISVSSSDGLAAATAAAVETFYDSASLATSQSPAGSPTSAPTASRQ